MFSQRSAQRLGATAGLTFGVLIVLVGPQRIMTWPTFAFFMLFAFVYARILSLFVGSLDLAPEKRSFDPFPNQHGMFKALSIIGVSGMTIGGLAGFFAFAEGVNSRIQLLIQKSCGYRNRERLKTDILFHFGALNLKPAFRQ
ncbi:MAG: hypothetical protein K9N49_08615 [Candidatus Marinimicrobia bacterium]|nr:hypothetical protein [Candidatus Neomarinimicrobiota bacterium]